MEIIREKFKELFQEHFYGNYSKCGTSIGIDSAHLHRFVNTGVGGGKKIIGAIIKFCKENDLDYNDYIRL